jgi:hypothetical protein
MDATQIAREAFVDEVRDRLRCCGATPTLDRGEAGVVRRCFHLDRDAVAVVSKVLRLRRARAGTSGGSGPLTFREYIAARRVTAGPVGEFVRDAQSVLTIQEDDPDGPLPLPDAQQWRELRAYLIAAGAGPEVISAGNDVWNDYRAERVWWKPSSAKKGPGRADRTAASGPPGPGR